MTVPEQAVEAAANAMAALEREGWAPSHFDYARAAIAALPKSQSGVERTEDQKDKLIEKLHVIAKNVSHALMSFTPGGSEYFTRVQVGDFEDYYADADACQRRVRERIDRAEERDREAHRAQGGEREDVAWEKIVYAAQEAAERLTCGLAMPGWTPRRLNVERARNDLQNIADAVLALPHTGQPQEGNPAVAWRVKAGEDYINFTIEAQARHFAAATRQTVQGLCVCDGTAEPFLPSE